VVKTDEVTAESIRLDAILRLLLEKQRKDDSVNVGDQILMLQDAGLSQSAAGRILGIEGNQIPSYIRRATNKRLRDKLAKKRGGSQS